MFFLPGSSDLCSVNFQSVAAHGLPVCVPDQFAGSGEVRPTRSLDGFQSLTRDNVDGSLNNRWQTTNDRLGGVVDGFDVAVDGPEQAHTVQDADRLERLSNPDRLTRRRQHLHETSVARQALVVGITGENVECMRGHVDERHENLRGEGTEPPTPPQGTII